MSGQATGKKIWKNKNEYYLEQVKNQIRKEEEMTSDFLEFKHMEYEMEKKTEKQIRGRAGNPRKLA